MSIAQSASPTTSVRSPFLNGWGLTGMKGIAAFSNTVAVMLLPAALLSEMYSENTSAS